MQTQLNVADARANLYSIVDASNPNNPIFLQLLNKGTKKMTDSGKWLGAIEAITITPTEINDSALGFITLPRRYQSILGTNFQRVPAPTYSQWHQYTENGPGWIDATWSYGGMLIDCGDGWPSQRVITEGTSPNLRFEISNPADAGKTVRFFGMKDNRRIFSADGEGIALTTVFPSAQTAQTFDKLTGIQKDEMIGNQNLYTVDGATVYQIGEYEPTETRPCYHRYQTNIIPTTGDDRVIKILAQRRWIKLVAETDWVIGQLRKQALGNMNLTELKKRIEKCK